MIEIPKQLLENFLNLQEEISAKVVSDEVARSFKDARRLEQQGKTDEAFAAYIDLVTIQPSHTHSWLRISTSLLNTGDVSTAHKLFSRLVNLNQKNLHARSGLARCAQQQKNWEAALEQYLEILKLDANQEKALFNSGVCLLRLQRYDQAVQAFSEYRQVFPNGSKGLIELARAHANQENWREALGYCEELLEHSPDDAVALLGKARALSQLHDTDQAEQAFIDLIEQQPQSIQAYTNYAQFAQQKSNWQLALEQWQQVLALDNNHKQAIQQEGICLLNLRRFTEAEQSLRKALRLYPESQATLRAYISLIQMYLRGELQADEFEASIEILKSEIARSVAQLTDFEEDLITLSITSRGAASLVFLFEHQSVKAIVKIFVGQAAVNEKRFLETWAAKGASVPNIIATGEIAEGILTGRAFIVYDFIDAKTLNHAYTPQELLSNNILRSMGGTLSSLHTATYTGEGFGPLFEDGSVRFTDFADWLDKTQLPIESLAELQAEYAFNDDEIDQYKKARRSLKTYAKKQPPVVYCHMDYKLEHIFDTLPLTIIDPSCHFNYAVTDVADALSRIVVNNHQSFQKWMVLDTLHGYLDCCSDKKIFSKRILRAAVIVRGYNGAWQFHKKYQKPFDVLGSTPKIIVEKQIGRFKLFLRQSKDYLK